MSDSILPKIFEGFPQLANQAESLETALEKLSERVEAQLASPAAPDNSAEIEALKSQVEAFESEHGALREQISALEAQKAELRTAAETPADPPETDGDGDLRAEVQHWKEKYDALAGRYDEEIAQAHSQSGDGAALEEKESLIQSLTQTKETSGAEIARLAEALAAAKKDAQDAQAQLETVNAQLADVKSNLETGEVSSDTAALQQELDDLKAARDAANTTISGLEASLKVAEEKVGASDDARAQAATRIGTLIESLSAAQSTGAA